MGTDGRKAMRPSRDTRENPWISAERNDPAETHTRIDEACEAATYGRTHIVDLEMAPALTMTQSEKRLGQWPRGVAVAGLASFAAATA